MVRLVVTSSVSYAAVPSEASGNLYVIILYSGITAPRLGWALNMV